MNIVELSSLLTFIPPAGWLLQYFDYCIRSFILWTSSNIFAISTPPDLVPIANHRRTEDENWTAGFGADEPQRLQARVWRPFPWRDGASGSSRAAAVPRILWWWHRRRNCVVWWYLRRSFEAEMAGIEVATSPSTSRQSEGSWGANQCQLITSLMYLKDTRRRKTTKTAHR